MKHAKIKRVADSLANMFMTNGEIALLHWPFFQNENIVSGHQNSFERTSAKKVTFIIFQHELSE